eukprot:gene12514-15727_t
MVMVLGMTLRVLTEPAVQDAWRIRFIQAITVFTRQNVTLDSIATYEAKGPDMPISVATTFTITFESFTTQDAANVEPSFPLANHTTLAPTPATTTAGLCLPIYSTSCLTPSPSSDAAPPPTPTPPPSPAPTAPTAPLVPRGPLRIPPQPRAYPLYPNPGGGDPPEGSTPPSSLPYPAPLAEDYTRPEGPGGRTPLPMPSPSPNADEADPFSSSIPPAPSPDSNQDVSSTTLGIIVGSAVGAIAVIAVIACAALYMSRRRMMLGHKRADGQDSTTLSNPGSGEDASPLSSPPSQGNAVGAGQTSTEGDGGHGGGGGGGEREAELLSPGGQLAQTAEEGGAVVSSDMVMLAPAGRPERGRKGQPGMKGDPIARISANDEEVFEHWPSQSTLGPVPEGSVTVIQSAAGLAGEDDHNLAAGQASLALAPGMGVATARSAPSGLPPKPSSSSSLAPQGGGLALHHSASAGLFRGSHSGEGGPGQALHHTGSAGNLHPRAGKGISSPFASVTNFVSDLLLPATSRKGTQQQAGASQRHRNTASPFASAGSFPTELSSTSTHSTSTVGTPASGKYLNPAYGMADGNPASANRSLHHMPHGAPNNLNQERFSPRTPSKGGMESATPHSFPDNYSSRGSSAYQPAGGSTAGLSASYGQHYRSDGTQVEASNTINHGDPEYHQSSVNPAYGQHYQQDMGQPAAGANSMYDQQHQQDMGQSAAGTNSTYATDNEQYQRDTVQPPASTNNTYATDGEYHAEGGCVANNRCYQQPNSHMQAGGHDASNVENVEKPIPYGFISSSYDSTVTERGASRMGHIIQLPPRPDVQFELDWSTNITVFREQMLGSGAIRIMFKGLFQESEVAIKGYHCFPDITVFRERMLGSGATRDITVFREQMLGSGAIRIMFKGLFQESEVAIKVIIPTLTSPSTPNSPSTSHHLHRDITVFREQMLGSGATGIVFRGLFQDFEVAIKVIIPTTSSHKALAMDQEDIASMQLELQIMGRLEHPNVVRVYGGCMTPPILFVVEELMKTDLAGQVRVYGGCMTPPNLFVVEELMEGDLASHIHRRGPGALQLSLLDALNLAMDIVRGLVYLHDLDIIHRDLKPGNILLNDQGVAKISDFGDSQDLKPGNILLNDQGGAKDSDVSLARCKYKTYLSTKKMDAGTVAYMAPECFNEKLGGVSTKCDIFSFGVIMWELVAQQRPWNKLNEFQMIYQVTVENARLKIPEDPVRCPPALRALIELCWNENPKERIGAHELERTLEAISKECGRPKERSRALEHVQKLEAMIAELEHFKERSRPKESSRPKEYSSAQELGQQLEAMIAGLEHSKERDRPKERSRALEHAQQLEVMIAGLEQ